MADVEEDQDLAVLTRLIALLLAEGRKQNEQILVLWKAGLDAREIANLVGTSVNTVRVQISNLRKREHVKIPERSRP